MRSEAVKYLQDVLDCIDTIDDFFSKEKKTFDNFSNNKLLRQAIERNFEIIGEAVNRLKKIETDIKLKNSKQIINLRNLIIHSYDNVNHEVLWAIIIKDLPDLKIEVRSLIEDFIS